MCPRLWKTLWTKVWTFVDEYGPTCVRLGVAAAILAAVPELRSPSPPPQPREPAPRVEVRRSARRRRTVAAYREGDTVVVMMPARFTRAEEREWVDTMLDRLDKRDSRRRPSDAGLARRARVLSRRHLDGEVQPASVRWADNQLARWGSCSVEEGSIRLSRRLEGMPPWVVDYVLMHELCHLLVPGHTPRFWALVERYPRAERARGYLEGISEAAGLPWTED